MKKHALLLLLVFSCGVLTTKAQNWKITESDNKIILIGEGWIKTLQGSDGYQEGEPNEYSDEMYEESEEETITMYNSAENRIVIINEPKQIYAEGTLEEYCDAMKSMREVMNADMLQQMIADQKAMPAPILSVTKEKGEPVMGYTTIKYTIESDKGFTEQKWITNDPALKEINQIYSEMMKFTYKLVSCAVPDASFLKSDPEFSEQYKEIQASGFELMSFSYDDLGTESAREVINIEKGVVPASEFNIPEGYSKRSLREFMKFM